MQVAIHLISGDVVETERAFCRLCQLLPIGARGFQQAVGAHDIGLDKIRRTVNGTVDMGLGRQVHDRIGFEACEHGADGGLVDDIGLDKLIAAVGRDAGQRLEVAGVSQLVQVEHFMLSVLNQVPDQGRANKSGTAGDENAHVEGLFLRRT